MLQVLMWDAGTESLLPLVTVSCANTAEHRAGKTEPSRAAQCSVMRVCRTYTLKYSV